MQDQIKQLEDEMQFYKTQTLELQRQLDAASTGAPMIATSEIIRQLQTLYNDIASADALAQARDARIAQLEAELATLTQTNQYEADINKQLHAQVQAHGQRATVERKRAEQLRLELAQAHRTIEGLRTENAKLWRRLNTREHGNE